MFAWYDFESEPQLNAGALGDPDKYYIIIAAVDVRDGSQDDEWACICHRTCGGKYPLDGPLANEKRERAQFIVDSLNDALCRMGG